MSYMVCHRICLNTNLAVDGRRGDLVQDAAGTDGGLLGGMDGGAVRGGGVGGSLS